MTTVPSGTSEVSEQLLKTMAEQAADVIMCNDEDGIFLYVSPSVETVLGWSPEELTRLFHGEAGP